MNTYKWDCKTVDVHPSEGGETNVIYNVHWRVTGVSDITGSNGNAYNSTSIGTQTLEFVSGSEFTEFDDLTNGVVVGWVKEAMGEELVNSIQEGLDSQITELQTPSSITLTVADGE